MAKPWNEHRATITKLYIQEGRTLEDVRGIMKTEYNFEASIRSYRQHFDIWGIGKYNCKKSQQRRLQSLKVTPPAPLRSPALSSSSDTGPEPAPSRASQQPPRVLEISSLGGTAISKSRDQYVSRMPPVSSDGQPSGQGRSTAPTPGSRRSGLRSQRLVVDHNMAEAPNGVATGESHEDKVDGEPRGGWYIVETIKNHRFRRNGGLVFQVKWKGFESERHLTWEPEKNLTVSGSMIIDEYFDSIGGRPKPKTRQEPGRAAGAKRRTQTVNDDSNTRPKRLRRQKAHVTDETSRATTEKWSPPLGSWEEEIQMISDCQEDKNGKLIVYLVWKNGEKTKHDRQVIYKKCPQMMLQFYQAHIKIVEKE
ncbi:Chromo domain-containing protein [Fusarium sp. Ph1]|nr:Chromo domain-containing protein [Fusarium sp. Ph1]